MNNAMLEALGQEMQEESFRLYQEMLAPTREKIGTDLLDTEDPQSVLEAAFRSWPPAEPQYLEYLAGEREAEYRISRENLYLYYGIKLTAEKRRPLQGTQDWTVHILVNAAEYEAYNRRVEEHNSNPDNDSVCPELPPSAWRPEIDLPGDIHGLPGIKVPKARYRAAGTLTLGVQVKNGRWALAWSFSKDDVHVAWGTLPPLANLNEALRVTIVQAFGCRGVDPLDGIRQLLNGEKLDNDAPRPSWVSGMVAGAGSAVHKVETEHNELTHQLWAAKAKMTVAWNIVPTLSVLAGVYFMLLKAIGGTNLNLALAGLFLFAVPIPLISYASTTLKERVKDIEYKIANHY